MASDGEAETQKKPKKKICCACPETKSARDSCIVEKGASPPGRPPRPRGRAAVRAGGVEARAGARTSARRVRARVPGFDLQVD